MDKQQLITAISPLFDDYMKSNQGLEVISLATTDGFPLLDTKKGNNEFETDKLAAASSTLFSVSNAVSRQILNKSFKVTFIEAEEGNIAFVSLSLDNDDFVLAMSAGEQVNIASLRMLINRLAKEVKSELS